MIRLLLLVAVVLPGLSLRAQEDDTIQFRQGLPVTIEDSTEYDHVDTSYPPAGYETVAVDDVPKKLRKTLDNDELYKGWRNAKIFFDAAADLYWVDFRLDNKIRRFGFNSNGAPVSVKEQDTGE